MKINEEIIVKYLAGETSAEENLMIKQWKLASDENKQKFDQLQEIWNSSENLTDKTEFDVENAWVKVDRAVKQKDIQKIKSKTISLKRFAMAASVILILGIGIFIQRTFRIEMKNLSANGELRTVVLSDGSEINVKEGLLNYPEKFKGNDRKVELIKGRAFFKVSPDKSKPFSIKCGETHVTVVGTEFEIFSNNEITKVKVLSGKVIFSDHDSKMELTKGMVGIHNNKSGDFSKEILEDENELAYATGNLIFKNKTLKTVIKDICANFQNCHITISPEIENCSLTASFKNEKLEQIIKVISVTMNAEMNYDKTSNTYFIKGKSCN